MVLHVSPQLWGQFGWPKLNIVPLCLSNGRKKIHGDGRCEMRSAESLGVKVGAMGDAEGSASEGAFSEGRTINLY